MITPEFAKAFLKKRELLDDEGSSAYEKTRKRSLDAYCRLLTVSVLFTPAMFRIGNKAEPVFFWAIWFGCSITIYNFSKEVMLLWKLRALFERRRVVHFDELFSDTSTQPPNPSYAPLFGTGRKERLTFRWLLAFYAVGFALIMWDILR